MALGFEHHRGSRKLSQKVVTTTPLGIGATFTSDDIPSDGYDFVTGTVFADQNGELRIQQSSDGTNFDGEQAISYTANEQTTFSVEIVSPTIRIEFENTSGSSQTVFRLYGHLKN